MTKLIIILTVLFTSSSFSKEKLSFEPLYGIERTQREYPKPTKYTTRTFLGLRGVYGTSALAGELEVSQARGTDDLPDTDESVDFTTQRALIGIRSYPIASQYFGVFFRAGARAQIQKRTIKGPTGSENQEDPMTFDPYAGTGLTVAIADNFALSAGATLIYNRDAPSSEKYDTQYSFSFTIRAGNTR